MSKMIPQRTVDALRWQVDVSLSNFGIPCSLFIPTTASYSDSEDKDVFATPQDLEFVEHQTNVFIEWGASIYKLKKLGIYAEDMVPLIAYFGNEATLASGSGAGDVVDVDICKQSYFTIEPRFIPNDYEGVESFEIVNEAVTGIHDAAITRVFSIVPRRVQES